MHLIERENMMVMLQQHLKKVSDEEGHCILISGEAGIGKTALMKEFCKQQKLSGNVFWGSCDDLFTPRPLGPLYDVLWQITKKSRSNGLSEKSRTELFIDFFQEIDALEGVVIVVFEDIHWADNGTLDFIQYAVRRIEQLSCLFILTFRENEMNLKPSLRNMLGQLPPDSYSKFELLPLSKPAVIEMATSKGFNGEEVFGISGGNPFYVNEILASYSPGIPEKIKNSILAVFYQQKTGVKNAWEIWSIIPDGLEVELVPKLKSSTDLENCFALDIIRVKDAKVVFKHEIYRRTIEETLNPIRKIELNKKMLELFLDIFEGNGQIERILHFAKHASERQLVVKYATLVARKAASAGSHQEAAKLWCTAIEYYEGNNTLPLTDLYERYIDECFLDGQIQEAIAYTQNVLEIRTKSAASDQMVACLCLLCRLWWIEGNSIRTGDFAKQALEYAGTQGVSTSATAMAYGTFADVGARAGTQAECLLWAERAFQMTKDTDNEEVLCRVMMVKGNVQIAQYASAEQAIEVLKQSLDKALSTSNFQLTGYAFLNLAGNAIRIKNYELAESTLVAGIRYCETQGLSFWNACLLSWKARLSLETGNWPEARSISDYLLKNESHPSIIKATALAVLGRILIRQKEDGIGLLQEAKRIAMDGLDLHAIFFSINALLEYEWLNDSQVIDTDDIMQVSALIQSSGTYEEQVEFSFWMMKASRKFQLADQDNSDIHAKLDCATVFNRQATYPYEQALILFNGSEDDKRNAVSIAQKLMATAVCEKMQQEMRSLGIKNIPRGIRSSTRANAALLTEREMEILTLLKGELQNKEIASQLFISAKTVDHHISNILVKLDTNSRHKAVAEAMRMGILK